MEENLNLIQEWDKTFPQSDKVNHKKITFHNRYGITLAADLYVPKNVTGKLPMFACFEYSHLDKCLAIMGADLLSSFEPAPLSALVLFILFTALINLIMVSATSKWAFMSFIFIPMFAQMGIAPDIAQCAFRIGDSSTNAITPFLFYMPLVLTYMRQYDKQITYGSLLKYTWRYSLGILVVWTLLFIVWYLLKIPMGL